MDYIFFKEGSQMPEEVSLVFAVIVIFGLIFIFFNFILRIWKYYWETMRPMLQTERRQAELTVLDRQESEHSGMSDGEFFQMMLNTNDNLREISTNIAGKYATKSEVKDVRDKVDSVSAEMSNIKGRLGY